MSRPDARLALVLSAALLLDPFILPAQETATGAFGEVLDIRVTSVDVVVTGPDGGPAAGLTAADFEIYENGKAQEITNFFEVGSGPSAGTITVAGQKPIEVSSPRSARQFIFYFDNGTLSVQNRNQIFPAVRAFLQENMEPGDETMIVTWNRALDVRLPWTRDLKAVDTMLETMAGELANASQLQLERRRVERAVDQLEIDAEDPATLTTFAMVEASVRSYAENVRHDMAQSVGAIAKLLSSLSGVEGRKVLVLATESLPTKAGGEMFEKLESIRTRAMVSTTSTLKSGARQGSRVVDSSKFNVAPMIEQLGIAANATGVTIYAINPRGTAKNEGKSDLQQPGDSSMDFGEAVQSLDGVNMLARKTGGVAMVGASAEVALDRIARDLGSYYSLGYKAGPGSSPNRNIEVRIKRPGHAVRARESVYYRTLETEMADRVIANQLRAEPTNDLGVSLEADPVTSDGSRQLLPMRIVIPVDSLTLLSDGAGGVTGGFSVFVCTGDGAGDASGVNVQSHQIKWPDAQAVQMKGRRIGFAVQVPIEKGRDQISVGVVDHLSQVQGFATMTVGSQPG